MKIDMCIFMHVSSCRGNLMFRSWRQPESSTLRSATTHRALWLGLVGPVAWGTTYIVAGALPLERPVWAAAFRALPASGLLLAWCALARRKQRRQAPSASAHFAEGYWPDPASMPWVRVFVLGVFNFALVFPFIFVAVAYLPGGIASAIGSVQPLVTVPFAWALLGEHPNARVWVLGLVTVAGVLLIVQPGRVPGLTGLSRHQAFSAITVPLSQRPTPGNRRSRNVDDRDVAAGVAAMLVATVAQACGNVLTKRWAPHLRRAGPMLESTAWQLLVGGLVTALAATALEGPPPALTIRALLALGYLVCIGTALAYAAWFRAVGALPASTAAVLLRLSTPVAVILDTLVSGTFPTMPQAFGVALVVGASVLSAGAVSSSPVLPSARSTRRITDATC
ncbi:MAG: DMT family transporter [Gemmatimonadaceae bacterium]